LITTIKKPGGSVIAERSKKYQTFTWGEGLIESTVGSGSEKRITTYTYNTSGYANGTRKPLEKINFPDGRWVRYEFDSATSRINKVINQYKNNADSTANSSNRVTEYDYNVLTANGDDGSLEPDSPRIVKEFLLNNLIGQTYTVRKTNGQTLTINAPIRAQH
jgi:predicted DNA-binding antitoxin AbrB/MazE fold protein